MLWIIVEYFLLLNRLVSPLCSRIMNIIQSCLAVIYSLLDGSMWDGDAKLRMQTQFSATTATVRCKYDQEIFSVKIYELFFREEWGERKKKSIDLGLRANRLSTPLTKIFISGFPLIIVHLTTPFFVEICLNWIGAFFFLFFFYFEECKIKITPLNDRFKTTLKRSVKDLNVQLNVLSEWKNGRASLGSQISLITTGDRQHLTRHQCKFGTSQVGFNSKL